MNRKLQVFISGTYKDLEVERRAAVDAILGAKHIPEGMEFFAAESREQMDVIKQKIRESDVLLILLGARYGSVEPDSGKSYTHLEFLYALEIKKPVIAMVMKPESVQAWEKENIKDIERNTGDKLEAFKKDVTNKRLASFFSNVDNLHSAILKALVNMNDNADLVGWVRRDATVDAAEAYKRLTAVETERDALRARVAELEAREKVAPPIPAEAERPFTLQVFEESGETQSCVTTYLALFRGMGRGLAAGMAFDVFTNVAHDYTMRLVNKVPEDASWDEMSLRTACYRILGSFALYGWVRTTSFVQDRDVTEVYTLTDQGRMLLLSLSDESLESSSSSDST